jgi:hypothetical protein
VQPAGDEVRATAEDFYSDSLRTWVEAYHQRQSEFAFLNMVHWGECSPPDGELDFRGRRYLAADAGRLLLQVREELERDREHLARFDGSVFRAHLRLARNLGWQEELCERYRCCRGVQDLAREMGQQTAAIWPATRQTTRNVRTPQRDRCDRTGDSGFFSRGFARGLRSILRQSVVAKHYSPRESSIQFERFARSAHAASQCGNNDFPGKSTNKSK